LRCAAWGEVWGDKGFMLMKRLPVASNPAGQCGVLSYPVAAVVNDTAPLPVPPPSPPTPAPVLPCECVQSCEDMCNAFGMKCCSGKNGNCNCQPARPDCCDTALRGSGSQVLLDLLAQQQQQQQQQ
jgi:hypothetical protein